MAVLSQAFSGDVRGSDELILLSSVPAARGPAGGLIVTQKYLAGAAEYAKTWPGRLTSLFRLAKEAVSEHDAIEIMPDGGSPGVELRPVSLAALEARIRNAALVVAPLSGDELPTARLCRAIGVPLVFISEYTLRTEFQIIDADTRNPLRRWRRKLWALGNHRARLAALALAQGIQCSGTPTYHAYRKRHANALLFFDNRVPAAQVIEAERLAARLAEIEAGRPLRLVFGGRLVAMKGVVDLPLVAMHLVRMGVPFTLDIYGIGPQAGALEQSIAAHGLQQKVRLHGALPFESGWLPVLREKTDLFLCCHRQGDPSSTYPEVMSCGVPIVGYANEAFVGIVEHSRAGWLSPIGKPRRLAQIVARLDGARHELVEMSRNARAFASSHIFEVTFARRALHMIEASRLHKAAPVGVPT